MHVSPECAITRSPHLVGDAEDHGEADVPEADNDGDELDVDLLFVSRLRRVLRLGDLGGSTIIS